MTVDACPWLDKKHTIFGKIEGPTLYNLIKLNEVEAGEGDRPVCDPLPRINRVIVVTNPFEDIVPRNLSLNEKFEQPNASSSLLLLDVSLPVAKKVVQNLKDKNLLSFDQDEEE